MTDQLDLLVMESRRHYADVTVATLEGAGHRVQRCYDPGRAACPAGA